MTLVLYDSMRLYASELVRYIAQQNSDIRTAVFFEMEELVAWCRQNRADILLASEELLDAQLTQVPAGRLVLLSEHESGPDPYPDSLPRVARYQSADEILSDVLLLCSSSDDMHTADAVCGVKTVFTVFYAPAPCPEQSDFARQYAVSRSGAAHVLYLSLQENAAFSDPSMGGRRRDVSDLLYLSMHRTQDFQMLLRSVICEDGELFCVPPPELASDLFEVADRDWRAFLQDMHCRSGFEEIVFDLEFLFPAAYEILELSQTIYLPLTQTESANGRLRHFLRIYEKRFGGEALGKLKEIRIGDHRQAS